MDDQERKTGWKQPVPRPMVIVTFTGIGIFLLPFILFFAFPESRVVQFFFGGFRVFIYCGLAYWSLYVYAQRATARYIAKEEAPPGLLGRWSERIILIVAIALMAGLTLVYLVEFLS